MQIPQQVSVSSRIQSIDFVRGLVMVLMAIDHVRVYSGLPAGGPEPGIFFTRWVTHFCAPVFVFLCGTSAFLYGLKLNDPAKLSRFLLTRGMLLVILELTLIRFCWTFNLNFSEFMLAGVIWMIGWCMVLMGLLVRFHARTVGIAGLVIIFLQNVFALVPNLVPSSLRVGFGYFWEFIYSSGLEGPPSMNILYVIVPWIGVMMAGYGFGILLQLHPSEQKKILVRIGSGAIVVYIILGSAFILLNPSEKALPFLLRLLNQNKYPASQLFLLMTLGPSIVIMPFVEKASGFISKALKLFGRVPFFYYLLHIPLIHISALIVNWIRDGASHQDWYSTAPYVWIPDESNRWNLGLLYMVFAVNVVLLYLICRGYESYKSSHPEKRWLKFL